MDYILLRKSLFKVVKEAKILGLYIIFKGQFGIKHQFDTKLTFKNNVQ